MARKTAFAIIAFACLASAAAAAPEPAKLGTTPPSSSHAPAQPEKTASVPEPVDGKAPAKAAAPAKTAWVSDWRKAYIAKHGHAPGAVEKAAAKKTGGKTLPKYKRCT